MHRFVIFFCVGLVALSGPNPLLSAQPRAAGSASSVNVVAASSLARIHGKIVSIDRARGTFLIHHDPFALMPMAMTMEVAPKVRSDLRKLHVGEVVDLTIDTSADPWPGTDIRPASQRRAGTR
jgi:Cu/Ag efflux protein CusF